jgi:hypothetical protein
MAHALPHACDNRPRESSCKWIFNHLDDVSRRLRSVCANFSDDKFDALARRIASITVKYETLIELRAARVDTPPELKPVRSTSGRMKAWSG